MSEIPEHLRGTYTTESVMGVAFHLGLNATTVTFTLLFPGGSQVLVDENSPLAKLVGITIVDKGKESEAVSFSTSDEDGDPSPGVVTVDKDGLHLDDVLVNAMAKNMIAMHNAQNPDETKEERDAAATKLRATAKNKLAHMTRYKGGGGGAALPVMVGGGAALILLLMVK